MLVSRPLLPMLWSLLRMILLGETQYALPFQSLFVILGKHLIRRVNILSPVIKAQG